MRVFTSGCFDGLHWGHISFLQRARALGDSLIVAIDSDETARRLKGPGRPACSAEQRMAMLRQLRSVDCVLVFEHDPYSLIEFLKPDIVVKGSEYGRDAPECALIESLGGRFVVLESLPIHTTDFISRTEQLEAEIRRLRQNMGYTEAVCE